MFPSVLLKRKRYNDIDFDSEHYIAIHDFKNWACYCQNKVPEIFDNFFGVVDGLITAFDGEHYFCCCSKFITKIRTRYLIQKDFVDGKHDTCPDEINAYFNERIKKEIRGVYIFQTWDLCSDCLLKYFYAVKGDLMT